MSEIEKEKSEFTSISIKPDTKARLEKLGKKGESWDELLNRLVFHENEKGES